MHEHAGPIMRTSTPPQSCPPCALCSRQYGLTLDLMNPSCLRRFKTLVALELLNALCFRGVAFATLAFRCSDELRTNSYTTSADMAFLPRLLMVVFSVLSIMDALRHAVRWLPAKTGARSLGQQATVPLQATDDDSQRAAQRPRSKAKVPGRATRQPPPTFPPDASDDDELVFGGAQDGPEPDDVEPADAPEPAVAARAAPSQRHRSRAVGDGLIFGKSHGGGRSVPAAARQASAEDAPQFPTGREVPKSAQRAESVVFPSKWAADDDDDGVSMVSAPITPLERQRRMAQAERERADADERRRLHADKVERARAQALDEAERQRERSARRSRAAEQQQREDEEQVRDRRRRRADADAVHQAQRDTQERGERLRVEAEQAANLSRGSTEAPPMVDHDSILTSGRLPKYLTPAPPAVEPHTPSLAYSRAQACLLLSAALVVPDVCVPTHALPAGARTTNTWASDTAQTTRS